jgi:hypothetical protein
MNKSNFMQAASGVASEGKGDWEVDINRLVESKIAGSFGTLYKVPLQPGRSRSRGRAGGPPAPGICSDPADPNKPPTLNYFVHDQRLHTRKTCARRWESAAQERRPVQAPARASSNLSTCLLLIMLAAAYDHTRSAAVIPAAPGG